MPPEQPNVFKTVFTTGHWSHKKTSPNPETLFLLRSTLMLSYLCVGLPSVLVFSIKLKYCIQVSCLTNASCLSHLHSLQLISYFLQSTNHEAPHYTFVTILPSLPPSWAQTFSAATSSVLIVYVLSFG
jgi:hypothetical protein